jgi:hypothetical protein
MDCGVDDSQVNQMELGKEGFGIPFLNKIAASVAVDLKDLLP